jgi:hypothetical protein
MSRLSTQLELIEDRSEIRQRLSASLFQGDSPLRWRGKVDVVSLESGIEGWALDLETPSVPLRLQLLAGNEVIAETSTGLKRPDVVALVGADAAPGFQFPPDVLLNLQEEWSKVPLRVGLVDERVEILGDTVLPSVGQLMAAETAPEIGFDLMDRLGSLRESGAAISALPLRPSASKEMGFIELLAIDENGLVWIQGWMSRSALIDAPAVVVDGRKEPAGFAYTFFERDDLPSDKCGFVGVVHSSWAPTITTIPFIFMKGESLAYLRCVNPARIIAHREFVASFRKLARRCHTGPTIALLRLIDNPGTWTPGETESLAALDCVSVIPGFGCIVSGWAVNPLRAPERFSLRLGATILTSDETSVSFRPRPDLANVVPGCDALLDRAGFVATFRGQIHAPDFDNALLKIFYEDGMTTCHSIPSKVFQRVGTAVEAEALLKHYPALLSEPFFGDLARALRYADRSAAGSWRVLKAAPARQAIVCVLPFGRPNAYLMAEQIRAHITHQPAMGVVLIADEVATRSDALVLRESLAASSGVSCALVVSRRPTQALYALDSILAACDCERFVFLGPGIYLTPLGWRAALGHLQSSGDAGCFLAVNDPAGLSEDQAHSAAAFGWTRRAVSEWLKRAPSFLGGYAGENGLAGHLATTYAGAAWFTRMLEGSPFVQAVNQIRP